MIIMDNVSKNVSIIFMLLIQIYGVLLEDTTTDKEGNSTENNDEVTPIRINSDSPFNPPEFSERITVNEPKKPHHGHQRPHFRPPPLAPQDDYPPMQPPPQRSPIYDNTYQPGYGGYDGYVPESGYYERPWNPRYQGKYYPGYSPSRTGGYVNPNYPGYYPSNAYPAGPTSSGYGKGYNPGYPDYIYGPRSGYGGGYGYKEYSPSGGYGILSGLFG